MFGDKESIQALDPNSLAKAIKSTAVVSGCSPSYSGSGLTIDVASGTVVVNGTEYSVTAGSVTLNSADSNYPRKDLVCIDGTGSIIKVTGTAEEVDPSGSSRFNSERPAPPDLETNDYVVIAEVWIPAGASSLSTSDVRDRRVILSETLRRQSNGTGLSLESRSTDPSSAQNGRIWLRSDL